MRRLLIPELTWHCGAFEPSLEILVGPKGTIQRVGPAGDGGPRGDEIEEVPLPGVALLPGFVNAHSHAFQRGLRGQGERFPAGAGSFWSWREAMYGLVAGLTPDRLFQISREAFSEMRRAGVSAVGEFHYLHHVGGGDFVGDEAVLAAASEAGIRIVLLQVYYKTGSIGGPLEGPQKQFEIPSLGAYWDQMERLAGLLEGSLQSLGVAAHSVRAAPWNEIAALFGEARRQGLPFHMHVEEQRQEIEECRAFYGKRPMELILSLPGSLEGFTAVHCTQTLPAHLRPFLDRGGRVCVCPLTEANLGDGIPNLHGTSLVGARLCLGSDSNARVSMLEEMRWLEYGQRLETESRGVLRDEAGAVAPVLLAAATRGGAGSLGLPTGEIAEGTPADLAAVRLREAGLGNAGREHLLEELLFGGGDGAIGMVEGG
jgi:formimidoylglutamate deiminase